LSPLTIPRTREEGNTRDSGRICSRSRSLSWVSLRLLSANRRFSLIGLSVTSCDAAGLDAPCAAAATEIRAFFLLLLAWPSLEPSYSSSFPNSPFDPMLASRTCSSCLDIECSCCFSSCVSSAPFLSLLLPSFSSFFSLKEAAVCVAREECRRFGGSNRGGEKKTPLRGGGGGCRGFPSHSCTLIPAMVCRRLESRCESESIRGAQGTIGAACDVLAS